MPLDEAELRDRLATERTHLANERTLLSYVRTALAVAAGGAALLEFYPTGPALRIVAWGLVAAGGVIALFGPLRFLTVRRRLRSAKRSGECAADD